MNARKERGSNQQRYTVVIAEEAAMVDVSINGSSFSVARHLEKFQTIFKVLMKQFLKQ